MRHKKAILPLMVVGLLLASFCYARALEQTNTPTTPGTSVQNKKGQLREEYQNMKEKIAAAKCTRVEKQVKNRISRFDNQQLNHLASYQKTKTLLEGKIKRLEEKSYEVTTLKADLVEYEKLVQDFKDDYAEYVTILKETQNYACGQSEGIFRSKLADARDQLKVVHQDAVAIRTFWAKTMRLHFLALKEQKPVGEEDSEAASEETDQTNESGA
jgi:hypothetical protein